MTEKVYKNINSSKLSWQLRNKLTDKENEHLIYGEISYESMSNIYSVLLIQK